MCAAFRETRETRFLDAGRRIFEAVKTRFEREDSLFAHAQSLSKPHFLLDQVLIIRAALDLYETQKREADLLFARSHADRIMTVFADSSGALKDRVPEVDGRAIARY